MNAVTRTILIVVFLLPRLLFAADQVQVQSNGVAVVNIGDSNPLNEMAVFPPNGIVGRPLLIAAHGNGGSGRQEIEGWIDLAKQHNFTIVCPTFLSANHSMHIPDDVPYFKDCLHWIEDNLSYDKNNAYMTGFSGGGYAVWYLATSRPDFFHGLFLQSGNFAGTDLFPLNLSGWFDKPIHLVWGTQDSPTVMAQNRQAVNLLKAKGFKSVSVEVIQGAHHEPHHDLVVKWLEEEREGEASN